MQVGDRSLMVVGDRVLIRPAEGDSVTRSGLILPASVADQDSVQSGHVAAVGPGFAVPPTGFDFADAWKEASAPPRYVAIQAQVGDLAVFYRKAAVELTLNHEKYVIVSQGAIVVLLREGPGIQDTSPH